MYVLKTKQTTKLQHGVAWRCASQQLKQKPKVKVRRVGRLHSLATEGIEDGKPPMELVSTVDTDVV